MSILELNFIGSMFLDRFKFGPGKDFLSLWFSELKSLLSIDYFNCLS